MKRIVKILFSIFGHNIIKKENKRHKPSETPNTISETEFPTLSEKFNHISFAYLAIQKLITDYNFETILDVGSGSGEHTKCFLDNNKKVTAIDFGKSVYFEKRSDSYNYLQADYNSYKFEKLFDAIWASHVLEHQPNPNYFLKKIFSDLKENGILTITVPPLKHQIVGGHVTLWNAGLILYQLVLAGFNCKDASILQYGYNISVIVRKKTIKKFPELAFDKGDIENLLEYFPDGFTEPFDGDIKILNW